MSNFTQQEATLKFSALSFRTEYTETALRRTVPIENSAPDGYMKIIQALVRASTKNDALLEIPQITSRYALESDKPPKNVIQNIAALSNQPFPIIISEKVINPDTNKTKVSSLVNPLTGESVAERYARVKLSRLGKLMTRYYKNIPVDGLDFYKSIVPLSLLRESTPWSTGYKGQMLPLNPKEIFQLMVKMIDYNSPMVEDEDLKKIFRGFDVGENYNIYIKSDSLISLYTMGEASCVIMPDIEIDRSKNTILFKKYAYASCSNDLHNHLVKRIQDKREYKTFKYRPTISVEGPSVRVLVTEWKGTDEEILAELYKDRRITKTLYLRHNVIRQRTKEEMDEINSSSMGFNPYDFELDVMPVYETLWRCIQWELEAKVGFRRLELADLREKLKYDVLLEKVTRPEVAKIVNEYNQYSKDKKERLAETCKKGSDILPEGFNSWEIDIIYEKSSNEILGKLFHREEFQDLYLTTQRKIKELEDIIANPTILMGEIKDELEQEINCGQYERKSKVFFTKEDSTIKSIRLEPRPEWDEEDVPCTIYYNATHLRRGFGKNIYFNDFKPAMSLNTTTHSKIMYMYQDKDGAERCEVMEARKIPTSISSMHLGLFRGILPVDMDESILIWTSHSRFKVIEGIQPTPLNFNEGEFIRGWVYHNAPYLDLRVKVGDMDGVQRVSASEFKFFKSGLKDTWDNIGSIYDMMSRFEDDEYIYLMRGNIKDKQKFERVLLKSRQANPIPIDNTNFYIFSPSLERYIDNVFVWKWNDVALTIEHHMPAQKRLIFKEHVYLNKKDKISKSIKDSVEARVMKSRIRTNVNDINDMFIIARTTKGYKNFDINTIEKNKQYIDKRLLEV